MNAVEMTKLTRANDGRTVYVNRFMISTIADEPAGTCLYFVGSENDYVIVSEPIDDVVRMIANTVIE